MSPRVPVARLLQVSAAEADVIPFHRRSQKQRVAPLPRFPLTSESEILYRPPAFAFSDDERTRVMPRPRSRPPPPPTPAEKAAASAHPIRARRPEPPADEPTVVLAPAIDDRSRVRREAPRLPVFDFDVPPVADGLASRLEPPPVARAPASTSVLSGPASTSDLPPAVVTSRLDAIGRPATSWAAALVAVGLLAGIVTAVIARGDGDAILRAGAQLVDPTLAAPPAAATAGGPIVQPTSMIAVAGVPAAALHAPPTPMTPVAVKPSCAEDRGAPSVQKTDTLGGARVDGEGDGSAVDVASLPPARLVQPAAPQARPRLPAAAPKVEKTATLAGARVAATPPPKVAVEKTATFAGARVAAAPPPKVAPVAKAPKSDGAGKSTDDAAAADALARAQLEAALGR